MIEVYRIDPKKNFIKEIADFIKENNPQDFTVIFPNIRPSVYLKKYLSDAGGFLPAVFSVDNFVKSVFLKRNQLFEADFYDIFRIFAVVLKNDLDKLAAKNLSCQQIFEISSIIWSEFEELKMNMIKASDLKNYDFVVGDMIKSFTGDSPKSKISHKIYRYSELYEKFYLNLVKHGFFTRALMYCDVATSEDFGKNKKFIFAGFFILTKSEKEILRKISRENDVYFFFQDSRLLDEVIDYVKVANSDNKQPLLNFNIKSISSKHVEIFELKKDLSTLLKNENKQTVAVILPDSSSLLPVIENVLSVSDRYNITIPCSAELTPWMSLFKILRKIHEEKIKDKKVYKYPVKHLLSLLSHPWVKNIFQTPPSPIQNRFEIFVTEKTIKERFFSDGKGRDLIFVFITGFNDIKNIAMFMSSAEKVIEYIESNNTDNRFISFGKLIRDKIMDIKLKLSDISFETLSGYFMFFEKMLGSISVAFETEAFERIQCMGVLESRLLSFDNVFIIDFNSNVIPEEKKDVFFLSDFVRKNLNLPPYSERFKLYLYHIENIIASSKNANIYYIDNKKTAKSPVLEKMIWDVEKNRNNIFDFKNVIYPQAGLRPHKPSEIKKDDEIKKILKDFSFSPSSVDVYVRCPVEFYFSYLVGINEENESGIIEKNDVGSFFHSVIDKTLKRYTGQIIGDIDLEKLKSEFEKNINEDIEIFDKNSPQTYFIHHQILKKAFELCEFLKDRFSRYTIKSTEIMKETSYKNFKIKGKADLIISEANSNIIIDFKTSAHSSEYIFSKRVFEKEEIYEYGRIKFSASLQLPFYIMLFRNFFEIDNACILLLGSPKCQLEYFYEDSDEKNTIQPRIENFIASVIDDIVNSDSFTPGENSQCNDCIYKDICSI